MPVAALIVVAQESRSSRSNAIPCEPMGITSKSGRTSRLKRFLSMPRYDGASRSRMKRGKSREGSAGDRVRPAGAKAEKACSTIDDLTNLWFRPFRDKLPRMEIIRDTRKKVREGFALFSAELKQSTRKYD